VSYPLFLKPSRGKHGVGAVAVVGFNKDKRTVTVADGHDLAIEAHLGSERVRRFGGLFQEHLRPHPDVRVVCGERLASVRLVIVLCRDGPQLFTAVMKIPTGTNMIDNFHHGETGNPLGQIDLDTGTVTRVVGPARATPASHPDTGRRLIGAQLPYWPTVVRTTMTGARALPAVRWQNWDIALCPDGPVALELNANADLDLIQYASGVGLDDARLRRFLEGIAPRRRRRQHSEGPPMRFSLAIALDSQWGLSTARARSARLRALRSIGRFQRSYRTQLRQRVGMDPSKASMSAVTSVAVRRKRPPEHPGHGPA
jgi:hypothetical protein